MANSADTPLQPLEGNASPGNAALMVFLGLGLVAASWFCTTIPHSIKAFLAGWIGIVFFSLATLVWARDIFRRGVILRVDNEGLEDKRLGTGKIVWNDVVQIQVIRLKSNTLIGIRLNNEADYLRRMPLIRRMLAYANKPLGYPAIQINFNGTDRRANDVVEFVRAAHPSLLSDG